MSLSPDDQARLDRHPLTPRQRVNEFFASIGLGNVNLERVIEAVWCHSAPLPKGEGAARMAEIITGYSAPLHVPPVYAKYLTADRVAERDRLQGALIDVMHEVEQRIREVEHRKRFAARRRERFAKRRAAHTASMRARERVEYIPVVDTVTHPQGRERRPACNQRTRGSTRSRAGPDDPDPPGVSHPPARRETAGAAS